jgi:hypothetical protein
MRKVHRMADRLKLLSPLVLVIGLTLLPGALSFPHSSRASTPEFFAEPSWQPADAEVVYQQLDEYLRTTPIPADRQRAARAAWWDSIDLPGAADDLLDRLARCLARTDDRVAELVAHCATAGRTVTLPDFAWLADSQTPALIRQNMRLYYARWLVQNFYDDEALAWTDGLSPADVVAPDALLFYRAVAEHRLVHADQADAIVAELLQRPDDLPIRYQKLAMLMQQDLAGLEDESLDHIARRMADVRRRLDLGRAGNAVQGVEQGVIESLDKLIKRLEELAQQQAASGAAGGQQSGSPMQDSRLAELKGPGKVEPRDIGHGADWGNLPEKEREQALQEIGRDFPSHYREVIEEYFRQLAAEPTDDLP